MDKRFPFNFQNIWLKKTFSIKGSVFQGVWKRSLLCGLFGLLIFLMYLNQWPVSQPILGSVIPSIVLGLLLVFRTNTAYDRFWEGRKLWGSTVNTIRNLAWQFSVSIKEVEPGDRDRKIQALRLLAALAIAKKLHLRYEAASDELKPLVSPSQYQVLLNTQNMPLKITHWLGDYLQQEYNLGLLTVHQLASINTLMTRLMDNVGGCERILKTPIPPAYVIHLNQLILLYCLMLPFQMVKELGFWTGIFVAIVSFALFGIEEIGVEIENPFGYDHNDLPLDKICQGIADNIEEVTHYNSAEDSRNILQADSNYF